MNMRKLAIAEFRTETFQCLFVCKSTGNTLRI